MSNLNLQKLREWVWPWPGTFNEHSRLPCGAWGKTAATNTFLCISISKIVSSSLHFWLFLCNVSWFQM